MSANSDQSGTSRIAGALIAVLIAGAPASSGAAAAAGQSAAGKCMTCHKEKSPGIYNQWYMSKHSAHNVTCIDCHGAERGEPDAFPHEGATIATLVTPKDCGGCHPKETGEVDASHHATAGLILESQDAYLAETAGGRPAAIAGCESCHGSKVKIDPDSPNRLARESWPNSGIGRLNPDGSKGSCNACHTRHSFSKAQARRPEACSKCHLGPDHPQKEVYEESKHGNAYYTHIDDMNLDADRWVVGIDYFEAPTCATCHMSAAPGEGLSHDVGQRISWTLRPPVSNMKENWREKRENMQKMCTSCHGLEFVRGHYFQMDGVVQLYNKKFAEPAGRIMTVIRERGLLENPSSFGNKIEWTYWELWHHEGRRARHGASMMGPDYTWWHGIYDVAQHFYFKFLPEARHYDDPEVNALIDDLLENDPFHQWMGRPTDEIKADLRSGRIQRFYEDLFKPE
ncbi:MAG: multiheme c-type cytochrome [Candidatus Eisenbacteria bacterium]